MFAHHGHLPDTVDDCMQIALSKLDDLPAGVPRLSDDQALAIVAYSYDLGIGSAFPNGDDNIFVQLNQLLRLRNAATMNTLRPYLAFMMRGLEALPAVSATVYRGLPGTPETLNMIRSQYSRGIYLHILTSNQYTNMIDNIVFALLICRETYSLECIQQHHHGYQCRQNSIRSSRRNHIQSSSLYWSKHRCIQCYS